MVVKKIEKSMEPDKISMFKNYDDVMQRILAEAKIERNEIDHQILLKKQEYQSLVDSIVRRQNEFEQWKRAELEKTQQEISKRKNEILAKEKMLSVSEEIIKRKMMEAEERERICSGLVDQRNKLNNDRIEVEKLHSRVSGMNMEAQKMMDKANSMLNQVSVRESRVREIETKTSGLNSELSTRENNLSAKEMDINNRLKNLEKVKDVVEPKILELKLLEENVKKLKRELDDEKNEVLKKIEEENSLLRGIEIREKKVKDREKELLQKGEEINRKALFAGIKND